MEEQGTKSKWSRLLEAFPNYAALLISVGGMIFSLGVMYNNVSSIKDRMDRAEENNIQVIKMTGDLALLHSQLQAASEAQIKTNNSVVDLTDAVNDLEESVSNLQGKLNVMPPPKRHRR